MKISVYVDGFNLYYGLLRNSPYKWLNPVSLVSRVLPKDCEIALLRYFTARITSKLDLDAPRRQNDYISALLTLPNVKVHYGHFLTKTTWRPLANLPVANREISSPNPAVLPPGSFKVAGVDERLLPVGSYKNTEAEENDGGLDPTSQDGNGLIAGFRSFEEKGSDVNLAVNLINDGWKREFDAMVVVSNDTDLVPAIDVVVSELEILVFVVCPQKRRVSPQLEKAATYVRHINPSALARSQFPEKLPGTAIQRPATW